MYRLRLLIFENFSHLSSSFSFYLLGPSEAIKWPEPYYQNRTIDVLVYLAKNMTAINQTEEYKGIGMKIVWI